MTAAEHPACTQNLFNFARAPLRVSGQSGEGRRFFFSKEDQFGHSAAIAHPRFAQDGLLQRSVLQRHEKSQRGLDETRSLGS
jgi:hypothetical protein